MEDLIEKVNIHAFLYNQQIRNEAGIVLDFHQHRFLWDIYADFSPRLVCLKAAQVGFTTMAILKSLWLAKNQGFDFIYTLPTSGDIKEMMGGKVNRIVTQNPILQQWIKDKDAVEQKQIGDNVGYYRGTWTERAALMVSSDLNIYDEIDRSKRETIEQYASRQQHSKNRWEWKFSNPSVIGQGVDIDWGLSDQKHWFIKCKCGHEQYLSWPDSIDPLRGVYQCKRCHEELKDRTNGRWIRKYRDREISGYWISLLMAPWVSAKQILEYNATKSQEYFYNFVLGLPYVSTGSVITLDMIEKNLTKIRVPQGKVIIGLDTGIDLRFVIGDQGGLFDYGECKSYQDFERVMKRYPDCIVVADQGGDLLGIRQLQEQYPGRIFMCFFQQDRKTMQLIRWGQKEEFGKVLVDRNRTFQLVVDELNDKRLPIYGDLDKWWNYWLHWSHVYRTVEEDKVTKRKKNIWNRNDRDDWVLATLYYRVGLDKFANYQSEFIGKDDNEIKETPIMQPGQLMSAPRVDFLSEIETQDWRLN